ncbi:MAG: ABC transporter permease [Chloroflexi bacterium]|nr:ABC transporter permease [Chloroflexota bacterium]
MIIGAVLSIGSALVPALHAVRWRIVDALDPFRRAQIPASEPAEGSLNRPLLVMGLALSALSGVVFFILPTAFLSGDPSLLGAVILCLLLTLLLGFTLAAMGALPLVERLVMAGLGWSFGPAAEMAGRNLERNWRHNVITALMFALSVCLVIFIASLVSLFSRTSMALVEHVYGVDIRLHSGQPRSENLKGELARMDGIAAASEVMFLHSRSQWGVANDVVISDVVGMKHLWIVPFGVDPDLAKVLYTNQIQYDEGNAGAFTKLAAEPAGPGKGGDADPVSPLILSLSAARFLDVRAGDLVELSFRLGSARSDRRFRVEAVCSAMPGFDNFRSRVANAVGSGALIPLAVFKTMTREAPEEAFQARYFVKVRGDAAQQKSVARQIREEFDARYRFGVQSAAEKKEEARALYWVTQVLFGLLLSVAVIIAVFALIASMATAVIERRWEIGVLKALGLRRGQLFRMFLGEAVVLTLSAGIAGGAIGFTLAYLFVLQAAALIEMRVVFTMPYLTFLATFAISVLAGALAAHLPTRQLLRKPAAEILRLET